MKTTKYFPKILWPKKSWIYAKLAYFFILTYFQIQRRICFICSLLIWNKYPKIDRLPDSSNLNTLLVKFYIFPQNLETSWFFINISIETTFLSSIWVFICSLYITNLNPNTNPNPNLNLTLTLTLGLCPKNLYKKSWTWEFN